LASYNILTLANSCLKSIKFVFELIEILSIDIALDMELRE